MLQPAGRQRVPARFGVDVGDYGRDLAGAAQKPGRHGQPPLRFQVTKAHGDPGTQPIRSQKCRWGTGEPLQIQDVEGSATELLSREKGRPLIEQWVAFAEALERAPEDFRKDYLVLHDRFCRKAWNSAWEVLTELRQAYPFLYDVYLRPYDNQIHFNVGVTSLQGMSPRDAEYYFQKVLEMDPRDRQAKDLLFFSQRYIDKKLGSDYRKFVDRLDFRQAGCETGR